MDRCGPQPRQWGRCCRFKWDRRSLMRCAMLSATRARLCRSSRSLGVFRNRGGGGGGSVKSVRYLAISVLCLYGVFTVSLRYLYAKSTRSGHKSAVNRTPSCIKSYDIEYDIGYGIGREIVRFRSRARGAAGLGVIESGSHAPLRLLDRPSSEPRDISADLRYRA